MFLFKCILNAEEEIFQVIRCNVFGMYAEPIASIFKTTLFFICLLSFPQTIAAAVDRINVNRTPSQEPFLPVSVHDLRRTFSSRLNDALFPEALIEAGLAHQKKNQVATAYNHAQFGGPRRALMQVWAGMLDCRMRGEAAREVIVQGKVKIDEAAHDAEGLNL